jgi:integrase
MNKSIKVVFIKQKPDDDYGYVFLRTIEGKITEKKSLKIKLSEVEWNKYFNSKTQRFREDKRYPNSEIFNTKIEGIINELHDVKNDLSFVSDDKKSFIDYWEFCLKNTKNNGTIIKHQVVISKLKKFLQSKKRTSLYFKEITPVFLRELKFYLETSKDPKSLSQNSVNHYLKIIKSIINKSIKDEYYTYVKHPFNSISFKKEKIMKGVLNEEELKLLINTKIKNEEINKTRNVFLFQLFSNGMRVSDVLLLKWKNISTSDVRINYTMFKTGTPLSLPINLNQSIILSKVLGFYENYQKLYELMTIDFTSSFQKPSPFGKNIVLKYTIKMFDDLIERKVVKDDGTNTTKTSSKSDRNRTGFSGSVSTKITKQEKLERIINYKGYKIWENDYELIRVIDKREELVGVINLMFINSVMGKINKLSNEVKNDFIFPLLSKEVFKNYDLDNRNLNLSQYKNLKHSTIVYNRKLKKLQEECKIETNLTSHVPRHSFTNLLLKMKGVNLYDISQSLGHTSLKTTENYVMSGFNVEKIDYLSKEISTKYNLSDK